MHKKHPWGRKYFQKAKSCPCVRCYLRANEGENKSNSAQQPRGPSAELLWKVCTTAGRAGQSTPERNVQLGGSLWQIWLPLMSTTTEWSALGSLCPLTGTNRHCLAERRLLEVNTLNILIKCIPHVLMAKSWLALPSYAAVSSRWDAHMYLPPCILGRARHSTALSVPRSPGGKNTQLHPVVPEKPAQLLGPRSEDLPSSQCLAEALEELQCSHPAGRKISIRLTCPTQRHSALHPANTEVLLPPNSTGEGADSSCITELKPSSSSDGIEGLLHILTITKFRSTGAFLQSLRVVELIWKPLY